MFSLKDLRNSFFGSFKKQETKKLESLFLEKSVVGTGGFVTWLLDEGHLSKANFLGY